MLGKPSEGLPHRLGHPLAPPLGQTRINISRRFSAFDGNQICQHNVKQMNQDSCCGNSHKALPAKGTCFWLTSSFCFHVTAVVFVTHYALCYDLTPLGSVTGSDYKQA